jgi:hypothetical protein
MIQAIHSGDHVRLPDGRTGWVRVDRHCGTTLALIHLDADTWEDATAINVVDTTEVVRVEEDMKTWR